MTKTQAIKAIKTIGRHMTARCEDGEYRVSFSIPAIQMVNDCSYAVARERNEAVAYYTDDVEDAIHTAISMHKRFVDSGRI